MLSPRPVPARSVVPALLLGLLVAALAPAAAHAAPAGAPDPHDQVVVEFTAAATPAQRAAVLGGRGVVDASGALRKEGAAGVAGAQVLTAHHGRRAALLRRLAANPGVALVEPVVLFHPADAFVPSDPQVADASSSGTWWLDAIGSLAAWNGSITGPTTGQGAVVAVIDSGVDAFHPDLAGKVLPGHDVPDGGDGAVASDDVNGHGTMISGIIAATANNGVGLAGIAPQAAILPVKVDDGLGDDSSAALAKGVLWATDHGADVLNLSLGSSYDSKLIHQAIRYAADHDVLVVAASGNHDPGEPAGVSYPAAYPEVLAVGAVNRAGVVASFSNTGPQVDVVAPGVSITSTSPDGAIADASPLRPTRKLYATEDGTSFSAPMVAALGALLRARGQTAAQAAATIRASATDMGPVGTDPQYGAGIIDVEKALALAPVVAHPTNRAPECHASTTSGAPVTVPGAAIAVPVSCGDPDGDPVTLSVSTAPTAGTVVLDPAAAFSGTSTFTAAPTFAGDVVSVVASDGTLTSTPVSVPVSLPPARLGAPGAVAAVRAAVAAHHGRKTPVAWRRLRCTTASTTRQVCDAVYSTGAGAHAWIGDVSVANVPVGTTTVKAVEFDGSTGAPRCYASRDPFSCVTPVSWSTTTAR